MFWAINQRHQRLHNEEALTQEALHSVVDRLKASRDQAEADMYQTGYGAGSAWARNIATYPELLNLERCQHELDDFLDGSGDIPAAQKLWLSLHPNAPYWPVPNESGKAMSEHWWREVLGENAPALVADPVFLHGFIMGATAVWKEVAPLLEQSRACSNGTGFQPI